MPNNRRFAEIMIGLLLLLFGVSALTSAAPFIVFMLMLVGIFLLVRQVNVDGGISGTFTSSSERQRQRPVPPPPVEQQQPNRERIYRHALKAVQSAGLNPDDVKVLTTDIGVMAIKNGQDPVIHRTRPVGDDVDYVQPFVELRLPTKATGRIRFEIIDADGQAIFIHEEHHELQRGRNLITPSARLPVHDALAMYGDWQMHVKADDVLLAAHTFEWQESTSSVVRRHLSEDGEISTELRAAMAESRLEKMSLDDLLEYDEDDEQQRRR